MCGGFNYLALNELKRKVPKKGIEKVKSSIIGSKSAVAVGGGGWVVQPDISNLPTYKMGSTSYLAKLQKRYYIF